MSGVYTETHGTMSYAEDVIDTSQEAEKVPVEPAGKRRPLKRRVDLSADDCGTEEGHRYHRLVLNERPCDACAVFRCGQEKEYSAHIRFRETPDEACRKARAEARRARRRRKQTTSAPGTEHVGDTADAEDTTVAEPAAEDPADQPDDTKNTDTGQGDGDGPPVLEDALGRDGRVYPHKVRLRGPAHHWSRHYRILGAERPVPAVSTLLKAAHKPELEAWVVRQISEWWLRSPDLLQGMSTEEAYAQVKRIPFLAQQLSVRRGQETHEALEMLLNCADTPESRVSMATGVLRGVLDGESQTSLAGAVEMINDLEATVTAAETIVWRLDDTDRVPAYAGTVDMLLSIPPDGKYARSIKWEHNYPIVAVADLKTGNDVWPRDQMQCAAYARATHLVRTDGTVVPMPTVHKAFLLHTSSRSRKLVTVNIDNAWEQFAPIAVEWRNHTHRRDALVESVVTYDLGGTTDETEQSDGDSVHVVKRREDLRRWLNDLHRRGVDRGELRAFLPEGLPVEDLNPTQIAQARASLRKVEDQLQAAVNGHQETPDRGPSPSRNGHSPVSGRRRGSQPRIAHVDDVEGQRESLRARLNDLHDNLGVPKATLNDLLPSDVPIGELTLGQIGEITRKLEKVKAPG